MSKIYLSYLSLSITFAQTKLETCVMFQSFKLFFLLYRHTNILCEFANSHEVNDVEASSNFDIRWALLPCYYLSKEMFVMALTYIKLHFIFPYLISANETRASRFASFHN